MMGIFSNIILKKKIRDNYLFTCGDSQCISKATYNIKTNKFYIIKEHSINLNSHSFINKCFYCEILKIFNNNKECKNIQIFKDIKNRKLIGRLFRI